MAQHTKPFAHTFLGLTDAILAIPPSADTQITVSGLEPALDAIGQVGTALGLLNNTTATTYVNTVPIGETGGGAAPGNTTGANGRLGGVAEHLPVFQSFASGGVVRARLAEVGAEMVTGRDGSRSLAVTDGLYAIDAGAYVHNFASTKGMMGGMGGGGASFGPFNVSVSVNMNGTSAVTRSQLKELGDTVASKVMGALKIATQEHFAGWR